MHVATEGTSRLPGLMVERRIVLGVAELLELLLGDKRDLLDWLRFHNLEFVEHWFRGAGRKVLGEFVTGSFDGRNTEI